MIRSMTGFAQASVDLESVRGAWELRSVNHRHLEIRPRLPEGYGDLEPMVREMLGAALDRGKVDIALRLETGRGAGLGLELDRDLARRLSEMGREVAREAGSSGGLSAQEILQWPGVVRAAAPDPEETRRKLGEALQEALGELVAAREREGAALAEALRSRVGKVEEEAERIRTRLPEVRKGLRERLERTLGDLADRLAPDRLEQEVILQVQRSDVDEEMDRLTAHIQELRRILEEGGPIGRRLDFLLQEVNREANTIGSKSPDAEVSRSVVEMKVLIEQMREQAQNIE